MVNVSGPLKIVTDKPSRVSEVWVGSPQTRPHGGGLLVEERDKVTPVAGMLSFTSVPGPVLLTLVSGGRVVDSVKGIVPDKSDATLAEVVASDHDWTPEQLTAFQQLTAQAEAAAAAAEADRIQTGKDRTQTGQDRTAAAGSATLAEDRANAAGGHAQAAAADRTQTGLDRVAAAQSAQGAHASEQAAGQHLAEIEPLAQGVEDAVPVVTAAASTAVGAAGTATEQAGIAEAAADRATLIADPDGTLASKVDLPTLEAAIATRQPRTHTATANTDITDLPAQVGDLIILDAASGIHYLLRVSSLPLSSTGGYETLHQWVEQVRTVAGKTGAVTLKAADITDLPTTISTALTSAQDYTDAKVDSLSVNDRTEFPISRLVITRRGGTVHISTTGVTNRTIDAADFANIELPSWARPFTDVPFTSLDGQHYGRLSVLGPVSFPASVGQIQLNFSYPV